MDLDKVTAIVRKHWTLIVVLTLVLVPSVWAVLTLHYEERIRTLEAQIAFLQEQRVADSPQPAAPLTGATPDRAAEASDSAGGETGVKFEKPVEGALLSIGQPFEVQGRVSRAPDGKDVWIVHRRARFGPGWPRRNKLSLTAQGDFSHEDWDHGAAGPLFICALAVERETSADFERWMRSGDATGDYPGLNVNQPAVQELGCVRAQLVK